MITDSVTPSPSLISPNGTNEIKQHNSQDSYSPARKSKHLVKQTVEKRRQKKPNTQNKSTKNLNKKSSTPSTIPSSCFHLLTDFFGIDSHLTLV